MKLYGLLASPYVARCWLTVAAKGGGADLALYEDGIKSDSYLAMNPMGKMPLLVDGDVALPESTVICEYLDEKLPGPALMPSDAAGKANVRLLIHIADLYLSRPSSELSRAAPGENADQVAAAIESADAGLGYIAHFIGDNGPAHGDGLTLADCCLQPSVNFALLVLAKHGAKDALDGHPKLARWWKSVAEQPALKDALAQIDADVQAFRKRRAEEAAKKAAAAAS